MAFTNELVIFKTFHVRQIVIFMQWEIIYLRGLQPFWQWYVD
jgi:hypothetical protein